MARTKKTEAPAAEIAETKAGLSFEDGIVLSTTLVLLIAVVFAYLQHSAFYGG